MSDNQNLQSRIVPQKKFESLDDFKKGQNNYYAYFLEGNGWGEARRILPCFKRFQDLYSELEKEVTKATCEAVSNSTELPLELLYDSYNIMSQLVFTDDDDVMEYTKPDEYLIS